MKRGLIEISNSFPEEDPDVLDSSPKKLKTELTEKQFPDLKTFSSYQHSEVLEMFRKLGTKDTILNCMANTDITGDMLFAIIGTLSELENPKESLKSMLKYIKIYFAGNGKACEHILQTLIEIYIPPRLDQHWVEKALNEVDKTQDCWLETLYEGALEHVFNCKRARKSTLTELKQTITNLDRGILFCSSIPLLQHEGFAQKLPIKNKALAKHYLPFIPSLHIKSSNDNILESMKENSVATIISPTGIGKTSLMIRRLCKCPGILITGTAINEADSGQTTDGAARSLANWLSKSRVESLAFIRQSVQILMISKLLFIIHLIDTSQNDPQVLNPFENNLCSFLAFNQFNGSNENVRQIFNDIFDECKGLDLDRMRSYTSKLIQEVKIKTNSAQFIICVDEANVIEEYVFLYYYVVNMKRHCTHKYFSVDGTERGALTVFASEILLVNRKGLNIFSGTSFSIDIGGLVQSIARKTGSTIMTTILTEFEYLDYQSFKEYMGRHVTVTEDVKKEGKFPIRIRQAALCLEYYIDNLINCGNETLQDCFNKSSNKMIKDIQTKALTMLSSKDSDFETAYQIHLMEYIVHHKYPESFGGSFHVPENLIAALMLKSGVACPVASSLKGKIEFKAKDVLGYKCAKKFLKIQAKVNGINQIFVGDNTDNCQSFELSYSIDLSALKGTIGDLLTSSMNVPLTEILTTHGINCNKLLSNNGFVIYCLIKQWYQQLNNASV